MSDGVFLRSSSVAVTDEVRLSSLGVTVVALNAVVVDDDDDADGVDVDEDEDEDGASLFRDGVACFVASLTALMIAAERVESGVALPVCCGGGATFPFSFSLSFPPRPTRRTLRMLCGVCCIGMIDIVQ